MTVVVHIIYLAVSSLTIPRRQFILTRIGNPEPRRPPQEPDLEVGARGVALWEDVGRGQDDAQHPHEHNGEEDLI